MQSIVDRVKPMWYYAIEPRVKPSSPSGCGGEARGGVNFENWTEYHHRAKLPSSGGERWTS